VIRQSDVTRAVKGAIDGYRARGLEPGAVSVSIADGSVNVRIDPPAESGARRDHEEIQAFAEAVRARASRRA
jgi:hypothetical protein